MQRKVGNKESVMMTKPKPKRTKCEIYSRIVGYLRPVEQWNEGKSAEFEDRVPFKVPEE